MAAVRKAVCLIVGWGAGSPVLFTGLEIAVSPRRRIRGTAPPAGSNALSIWRPGFTHWLFAPSVPGPNNDVELAC